VNGPVPKLDEHGLPLGHARREGQEVTPRETRRLLEDPGSGLLLIDCRTPEEHHIARIQGAVLIPLTELEGRLDEIRDELEENPSRPVVVHCHHGMRSLRAVSVLQARGVPQARSMAGGIDLWSVDIDPSVPRYK
jgi:rhodanese-related sulfurtransferase